MFESLLEIFLRQRYLLYAGVIKQCPGHSVARFDLFPLEKLYVHNENIDRIGSDLDRLPLKIFVLQMLA